MGLRVFHDFQTVRNELEIKSWPLNIYTSLGSVYPLMNNLLSFEENKTASLNAFLCLHENEHLGKGSNNQNGSATSMFSMQIE